MNRFHVVLLALMPALAAADITTFADCIPGAVNNGNAAGVADNFAKLKALGDLAVVARDPTSDETGLKCMVLNLMASNNYTLRYKDASGAVKNVSGNYTDQRTTVPVFNTQDAYAQLQGLPSGVLNNGALFPVVFAQDEVILQTCRFGVLGGTRSTYVLVPLAKAKASAANAGCACDNWNTA